MTDLFEPLAAGLLDLPNRLVMAPMTRSRSTPDGVPGPHVAEYYKQRAGAGLIVSESIFPEPRGKGYILTPGLHSAEQVGAWRDVTDAVHGAGGRIVAQLTHTGRIGHPSLYPDGALPLAPSAVASGVQLFTGEGMVDHPVPEAMSRDQITQAVRAFADAARLALEAGFDGVELHGGNGYLVHQFLAENTNQRDDEYGGDVAGRTRFAVEVASALADAVGAARVGLRFSPGGTFNSIDEADPAMIYTALLESLAQTPFAYVHLVEGGDRTLTERLRAAWPGVLILNPHPTPDAFPATAEAAQEAVASGVADAAALGELWLANPDLDVRVRAGGPYNAADRATFYGGDAGGYTDYPRLGDEGAA